MNFRALVDLAMVSYWAAFDWRSLSVSALGVELRRCWRAAIWRSSSLRTYFHHWLVVFTGKETAVLMMEIMFVTPRPSLEEVYPPWFTSTASP